MIGLPEFAKEVLDMRSMQVEYFKRRDPIVLQRCKAQERKVDSLVKAVTNKEPEEKQLNLF
jgi:hypothetical protein